jgi:hypothetical protein
MSLFMALSGHRMVCGECPLSGVKRTKPIKAVMSAKDPKATLHAHPAVHAQSKFGSSEAVVQAVKPLMRDCSIVTTETLQ